jgi:hypothetical protein
LTARQGAGGSEDVLRSIPDGAAPYPFGAVRGIAANLVDQRLGDSPRLLVV